MVGLNEVTTNQKYKKNTQIVPLLSLFYKKYNNKTNKLTKNDQL